MSPSRLVGLALLVAGVLLLAFGLNATHAPVDRLSEAFTGKYTDRTMLYLVGGAVAAVVGIGMMAMAGRRG